MTTKLDGKKHIIENYTGKKDISLNVEMGHSVYIYNCKDCVIQIKGKIAAISIDKASKSGIVWESSIGSAEVVNSQGCQLQGSAPAYAIDKSNSISLFLTKADAAQCQVFTSLSSEVNITVLEEGDKDPVETAVPSQFVTTYKGGKWHTEHVAHVGV